MVLVPEQPAENPPVLAGTVVERIINAKRQPVVPAWIRDDVTRRAAVKYGIRHAGHITVFHAARSPSTRAARCCTARGASPGSCTG